MRFFGALLLIFVLLLQEIEASNFYKGIITEIDSVKRQKDRRAIVSTPRPSRGQAPARNPASLGQQALDLRAYAPRIPESSEQPDVTLRLGYTPTDTSDVGSSSMRIRGSSVRGASSTGRIQNDQIPYQVQGYQQQGYQQQGYQQQYLQENSAWSNHHHATAAIPAPQYGDISLGYQNPNDGTSNMPSNIPTQQPERKLSKKEIRDMVRSELAARREQQIWEAEMAYQNYNSHHPYGYSNAPHPWDHSGGPGSGTQY